jgi:hypothetical protein
MRYCQRRVEMKKILCAIVGIKPSGSASIFVFREGDRMCIHSMDWYSTRYDDARCIDCWHGRCPKTTIFSTFIDCSEFMVFDTSEEAYQFEEDMEKLALLENPVIDDDIPF